MGLTGWRSWNNWTFEENFQGSLSRSEGPDGLRKWIHDLLCENRGTAETVEWKSSVYTIPLYGRSHTGPSLVAFPASTVTSGGGKSFRRANSTAELFPVTEEAPLTRPYGAPSPTRPKPTG
jgi:hypothetical protein